MSHPCRGKASETPCGSAEKPFGSRAADTGAVDPFTYFGRMIPNCLAYAKAAKAQGQPIVGILCEFTPREIIMAAGAARGIIVWRYVWCDHWAAFVPRLRRATGLPVLDLDVSADKGHPARVSNRIQAFLEILT